MGTSEFFVRQYDDVRSIVDGMVLKDISDNQMRRPSEAGLNSLVWYLWHISRWNDVAARVVAQESEQVLDQQWLQRMNVTCRDCGTGMTADECAAFNAQVDPGGVRAYWGAVGERVQQVGRSVPSDQWGKSVEESRLSEVLGDGVIGSERARWIESFVAGKTKAWWLSFTVWHTAEHFLGGAIYVRWLKGIPLGL